MKNDKPTLIYILGAGRSGTTLVDIVLGNSTDTLSCGELNRYGKRNGISPGIENSNPLYAIWTARRNKLIKSHGVGAIEEMRQLSDEFEYHKGYIKHKLIGKGKRFLRYSELNKSLIKYIQSDYKDKLLIDSSKYPGRLNNLVDMGFDVKVVYVRRDPVDVVRSFAKKGIEQPSKHWLPAAIYCFMVALICKWTYFKVKSNVTWFDLDYADFVNKPEESLENLEKTLCVDTQGIIGLIKSHEKLEVGPLFDGNRIRLKSDLELKPTSKVVSMDFKDRFVRIFNYPFYH